MTTWFGGQPSAHVHFHLHPHPRPRSRLYCHAGLVSGTRRREPAAKAWRCTPIPSAPGLLGALFTASGVSEGAGRGGANTSVSMSRVRDRRTISGCDERMERDLDGGEQTSGDKGHGWMGKEIGDEAKDTSGKEATSDDKLLKEDTGNPDEEKRKTAKVTAQTTASQWMADDKNKACKDAQA
ncbi:uncharacterized protein SPSK_09886 [Sporothrix schenckii 1099-18]|uniref:Uncharacterized protein n=1 Tax=Sporothrix schenckii 1099-18 TaxID=1397361 RepID=A0A0F2MCM3_SPOSC|nr:uncharacterized protein SPSK_09886 [Sporothrix schenckii 1099-18]KJR85911.1 hypothetical protein SPSK_09886 [Sporothrix schenckii 1099-18]